MITVLGSTNTDMVISGDHLPVPGETISDGTFLMNPGGKGANQAVAVARLSKKRGNCRFIAKVGKDLFGEETAANMKRDGIDAKLIVDRKTASGTALILVDKNGQNVISVALGANGTLSPKDLKPYAKDIAASDALLMQLETPIETVLAAAKIAAKAKVPVILNPAPARQLPAELFKLVDWITPNETEAEILTGMKVTDGKSAHRAEKSLIRKGVKHAVITMGSKGCYCSEGGMLSPCKKVKAVDCVAAGDTFNGAFVVALTEGKNFAEAIDFAQKAAAISVTRKGAQSSVPYRKEIK